MLEIGGVKEKVLAAYRAGLREVIMPKGNEKDLRDVPQEVRDKMAFTFARTMDEVLHLALLPVATPSGPPADRADPERVELADAPVPIADDSAAIAPGQSRTAVHQRVRPRSSR